MDTKRQPKKPDTRLKVTETNELLLFLLAKLPHKNRQNIKILLREKQILVDGKPVSQFNYLLKPNQEVTIKWERAPEVIKYKGLSIVYEDQHLIVINKQDGLLSIATEKVKDHNAYAILSAHIKKENPANRIFVVHRLDKDTSGLMMFAKSEKVQKLLQETWGPTTKERVYLAVTEGPIEKTEGVITSYLQETKALIVYSTQNPNAGQKATTYYETLQRNEHYSMLKVVLETGRKNQVRVHMQSIGHPIIGDSKYGAKTNPIGRLGLHAWVLGFTHPITNEPMHFKTPIPKKFWSLF